MCLTAPPLLCVCVSGWMSGWVADLHVPKVSKLLLLLIPIVTRATRVHLFLAHQLGLDFIMYSNLFSSGAYNVTVSHRKSIMDNDLMPTPVKVQIVIV